MRREPLLSPSTRRSGRRGVNDYVIDASAMVAALTRKDAIGKAIRVIISDAHTHAPYLIDAEVGHALRSLERRGDVTEDDAVIGLRALRGLIDDRYDHTELLTQAWIVRHTITFYDGLYVALAAVLGMPLLTGDIRLSKAPGLPCAIELVR